MAIEQRISGLGHYPRPCMVTFIGCTDVLMENYQTNNTPFWQHNPINCRNIVIRGVKADSTGLNNDGFDPDACDNVLCENVEFNTGDDCIAIKSGKNLDTQYGASKNQVIRDCIMHSGHGGVTLGSEMSGGIENVFAENIDMNSSELDIALRFKTNTRRGGVMRNYYARNIRVPNGVSANNGAITIDYFYRADASDDPAESGPYRPYTDGIYITNITVGRGTKAGTKAFDIRGFATGTAPTPTPPNFVANTPRAGTAGSVGVNDAIGVVRVRNSTFNVSTTADVIENVDLRLESVTINRS